jgi:predicted metalloprotease with PDZ domain
MMQLDTAKSPKALFLMVFIFLLTLFSIQLPAQTIAKIDLTKATGDHRLFVELNPPEITAETVELHFPKIVPGTYVINNFGRFVTNVRSFDESGNLLAVERLDTNRWLLNDAGKIKKVSYWVEDSYHSDKTPAVFEPVGLCIDSAKVFVLNNYCYIGYFDGYKEQRFELNVTKPQGFYGATSLPLTRTDEYTDHFEAKNYFELHDNPIMYSVPDTASVMVKNTRVLLSGYSVKNTNIASYLITHTEELFEAQGKYLGGNLPADKYSILLYMYEGTSRSGSAGALEHFQSTTMSYPDIPKEEMVEPFVDVISHEFFHIITPLGIHSKEVHNFDFINPKMSRHLWLYEGSTEYYSHHCQVKGGIVPPERFFEKISQKIMISSLYFNDTLPFTELSSNALDFHKNQYVNVYQKGALISMCLDLELLRLSGGKYGLQNLKDELLQKFGPDKPFEDEELFEIITAMTYPEIRNFFRDYVEGTKRLPYKQFLGYAGYDFFESIDKEVPAMIGATMSSSGGRFEVVELKEFGKALKLKEGDIIESVNGVDITAHSLHEAAAKFESSVKPGDEVTVVVQRKNGNGELVKKVLKAKTFLVKLKRQYVILPVKRPTDEQLALRKSWINQ